MLIRRITLEQIKEAQDTVRASGGDERRYLYNMVLWVWGWAEHDRHHFQTTKEGYLNLYFLKENDPLLDHMIPIL